MVTQEEKHKKITNFICNECDFPIANLLHAIDYLSLHGFVPKDKYYRLHHIWNNYIWNSNKNSLSLLIHLVYKEFLDNNLFKNVKEG